MVYVWITAQLFVVYYRSGLPVLQRGDGVTVAPSTYNQRVALISTFYGYAIAHEALKGPNPLAKELVERKTVGEKDAAHYLPKEKNKREPLPVLDHSTVDGLRDYALLDVLPLNRAQV